MPLGLTKAPAIFQNLVRNIFKYLLNKLPFVKMDDILHFSNSLNELKKNVNQRLLENSFFVKAEKYEFHVSSMSSLDLCLRVDRWKLTWIEPEQVSIAPFPIQTTRFTRAYSSPEDSPRLREMYSIILERTKLAVIIWTDHKNLSNLLSAKQLYRCKFQSSLFFSRFYLTITYCLHFKNHKPDALSGHHNNNSPSESLESVISAFLDP